MKTEDLTALGLTDEQKEKVFAMHGKEIETYKATITNITTERDGLKKQMEDRDKDFESLKKEAGNSEELNKKFNDLQEKYNNETTSLKDQLSKQAKEHAAEKFFDGIEFASDRIKSSIIEDFKSQDFKFNDESKTFQGGKEWLDSIMEKEPTSFKNSQENNNQTGFRANTGAQHGNSSQPDFDSMSDADYYAYMRDKNKT